MRGRGKEMPRRRREDEEPEIPHVSCDFFWVGEELEGVGNPVIAIRDHTTGYMNGLFV